MNYIEFQIKNNTVYVYDSLSNVSTKLSYEEAIAIIRKLLILDVKSKEIELEVGSCLQFYDVSISTVLEQKSRSIPKKVSRINKFRNPIIKASAIVMTILTINSVASSQLKEKSKDAKDNTSVVGTLTKAEPTFLKNEESIVVNDEEYAIGNSGLLENNDNQVDNNTFYFNYEDRSYNDKAMFTREMYSDLISKYSKMYGLSQNLMLAVATQESGIHSDVISNGGGLGLFQIQVIGDWNWLGKELSAYNFNLGVEETIEVGKTLNGNIDYSLVGDLEYNVKVACMIMASNLEMCNYDIIEAIQIYNSGTGVLSLKDMYGSKWVEHRENLPGDPMYLEHVLSYVPIENNTLYCVSQDDRVYSINVLSNESIHVSSKSK